ncbi:hypothetical protein [uncultured Tateyamaria sp.]|uniref:hypothetical protein n=1 Tax=Tateyamaria sp. 1078 TaxID=3417464 RepID=UPI002637FC07|nr:hypothetical protein [uncultured Tateyamaria sp.]
MSTTDNVVKIHTRSNEGAPAGNGQRPREDLTACQLLDLRDACLLARRIFYRVEQGQTGLNLVQSSTGLNGGDFDQNDEGYSFVYRGFAGTRCKSPFGAIIIWAHQVVAGDVL